MDDWSRQQALRAVWMSFIGGNTQTQIAQTLGCSQAKVHRLIAQALEEGLVRLEIAERPRQTLELENRFIERYGLRNCLVVPIPEEASAADERAMEAVGTIAGRYLGTLLADDTVSQIGVGMGRTIAVAVAAMPALNRPGLAIVAISGSLTRRLTANPFDVIQAFQSRTKGDGYFLPVPYFARSLDEKRVLHSQESVQELMQRAVRSDLFFVGVGSLEPNGHLSRTGMISEEERLDLLSRGAVGDLMGRFVDIDGELVPSALGDLAVGLHHEDIRGKRIVSLAAGLSKAQATLAVLRSRVVTDMVLDEPLANRIRELEEQEIRRENDHG
ncbi:MAG: sugar-binding domain-containing protein [Geminicoccaceae bacterium]